jgi:hypothetical protein
VADLRREFIHTKLSQLTGRSPLSFMHTKVVGMLSTKLSLLLLISVHCIDPNNFAETAQQMMPALAKRFWQGFQCCTMTT